MNQFRKPALTLGGVALAAVLAAAAYPFFAPSVAAQATPPASGLTKSFSSAPAKQVFDWLRAIGVNFVVEDTSLKNRTVSMNVVNQSPESVLEAVGAAMDMNVERKGGVYVLRAPGIAGFRADSIPPMVREEVERSFKTMPRGLAVPPARPMTESERKALEKEMEELRKQMKDLPAKIHVVPGREMTESERKAFEKSMEELRKNLGQIPPFKFDGSGGRAMTKEEREKFEKAMEELRKNMKEAPLRFDDRGRVTPPRAGAAVRVEVPDYFGLMKSLTPAQKELMKSRGHLTLKDLTAEQRRMLGVRAEGGQVSISITQGSETLVIKSE